MAKNSFV